MHIKAVLFDYGGTLDSDGLTWLNRFSTLYREHGIDTGLEPFRRAFYDADDNLPARFDLRGLGLERTLLLQAGCVCKSLGQGEALAQDVVRSFLDSSRSFFRRNLPLLKELRSRYRLGVVSNFYGNLDSILAGEGLLDLFDVVSESEKVGVIKPEPGIFLHAVNAVGCAPNEALMVGDSIRRDMRGAEGLGMPHAWLAGGHDASGRCCGRAHVLRSLLDLGPLLLDRPTLHAGFAGIIAAGEGSRLKEARPGTPKPLVSVAGRPLVHWVVEGLRAAGARSIVILLNTSGDAVRSYLESAFPDVTWTFLREDTASSWESFRLVSRRLASETERFIISTVDALIPPADVARFAREALSGPEAAALAVTPFVDDEKPLWADLDDAGRVSALGARASQRRCATCGLYALRRSTALDMPPAPTYARLRDYWAALVESGSPVRGMVLGKTIDVDRPQDLGIAEAAVRAF